MRPATLTAALLTVATAWLITSCGGQGDSPAVRDAAGCLAAVSTVIRDAPVSAANPVTGAWLGHVDHLRDLASTFNDPVDQQVAAELDYAGGQVAMLGTPPQIAIIPAQETCTISDPASRSVSPAAAAAARAWLQGNPPPDRPGMAAGVITQVATRFGWCPASGRALRVVRGGGCETWAITLTTITGTLRVMCGNPAVGAACTLATARPGPDQFIPDIGDVLYAPGDGQVTAAAGIAVIYQVPWAEFSARAAHGGGS